MENSNDVQNTTNVGNEDLANVSCRACFYVEHHHQIPKYGYCKKLRESRLIMGMGDVLLTDKDLFSCRYFKPCN